MGPTGGARSPVLRAYVRCRRVRCGRRVRVRRGRRVRVRRDVHSRRADTSVARRQSNVCRWSGSATARQTVRTGRTRARATRAARACGARTENSRRRSADATRAHRARPLCRMRLGVTSDCVLRRVCCATASGTAKTALTKRRLPADTQIKITTSSARPASSGRHWACASWWAGRARSPQRAGPRCAADAAPCPSERCAAGQTASCESAAVAAFL